MPIVVRNISLQLGEPEELVLDRVVSRLGITAADVRHHAIVRRSLDARKHDDIHFVYSVELTLAGGMAAEDQCIRRRRNRNIERIVQKPVKVVDPGTAGLSHRPVIVGFGPAGMFAALRLAELGYCPIVLERGKSVRYLSFNTDDFIVFNH